MIIFFIISVYSISWKKMYECMNKGIKQDCKELYQGCIQKDQCIKQVNHLFTKCPFQSQNDNPFNNQCYISEAWKLKDSQHLLKCLNDLCNFIGQEQRNIYWCIEKSIMEDCNEYVDESDNTKDERIFQCLFKSKCDGKLEQCIKNQCNQFLQNQL